MQHYSNQALAGSLTRQDCQTHKLAKFIVSTTIFGIALIACLALPPVISSTNSASLAPSIFETKQAYAATTPAKTSIKKLYSKSLSGITVTLDKKSGVSGYQVRYSTKASMKGAKTKKSSSKTVKITKLKSGKKYYVQARTYKKYGNTIKYSAWSSKKSKSVSKISGSQLSYPAEITLGSSYDFVGKVSSNYSIKKIKAVILNSSGKTVQSVTVKPGKKSYQIYNSKIDNSLTCGKLKAGTYKYRLRVYVNETSKRLISKKFTVKKSGSVYTDTSGGTKMALSNNSNAKIIYQYAIKKGCTKAVAAAIVGNAQQESSLNPSCTSKDVLDSKGKVDAAATKKENRRIGYGLFQVTGTRYDALEAYAKSKGKKMSDINVQLDFLFMELNSYTLNGTWHNSEWFGSNYKINNAKTTLSYWMSWKNVDMATEAFCECYERAGKPLMDKRKAYARQAYTLATQNKW